jgi:preprotein translocase SecE subunit
MNLSIYRYKQDQGRLARGSLFGLHTLLLYYGCYSLYFFLHWDWAVNPLMSGQIPILNIPINPALIIAMGVFFGGEWAAIRLLNSPKLGTLLIETETEMKKVTWPSWNDSFNSSVVVLIAVVFFMIFLGFADVILNFIFSKIVFAGLA